VHAFAARVTGDSYFSLLLRFGIIPVGLFSGVYFPVAALPGTVRPLAYLSPLWHATEMSRAATLGGALSFVSVLGHVAYLGAWLAVGFWLAVRVFRRRLVT